jgi:hypothetical protein
MLNCASFFRFLDMIGSAEAQHARTINPSAARVVADVRAHFHSIRCVLGCKYTNIRGSPAGNKSMPCGTALWGLKISLGFLHQDQSEPYFTQQLSLASNNNTNKVLEGFSICTFAA